MIRLKRGDVVTVAAGSGFGGKPRPALMVQADRYAELPTVLINLFTTQLANSPNARPHFEPNARNGLREACDLMIDITLAVPARKVGGLIGRLDPADMARVDRSLLLMFGLA